MEEFQRIAEGPDGGLYSPVPGLVERIWDITLPAGWQTSAAQIRLEGSFTRSAQVLNPFSWEDKKPEALVSLLKEKGVLFQSSGLLPLEPVPQGTFPVLLINAVQTEPYLTLPLHLLKHYLREIREAILILQHIYGSVSTIFAVNQSSEHLLAEQESPFEMRSFKEIYPAAHPTLLKKSLLGDKSQDGVLIANLETLLWIYDAVVWNRPVTERFVVYSGRGFSKSGVIKARIGTPFADLIQDCGGFTTVPQVILTGGPFLGRPAQELWQPLTMDTQGLLALVPSEVQASQESECIRCGACIEVCPVGLHPVNLHFSLLYSGLEEARNSGLDACISCGLCSYICPSRVPLMENFLKNSKKEILRGS